MNLFIHSHLELIKLLLKEQVDFIIIGGYAVIFHGYSRTTGDVDIWLKPDNSNREKFIKVLVQLDLEEDDINIVSQEDFTDVLKFSMDQSPERVDFLTHINNVTYQEADEQKVFSDFEDIKIPFLHLNHLILSKINTGRVKDKADIEELQKIEKSRNKS